MAEFPQDVIAGGVTPNLDTTDYQTVDGLNQMKVPVLAPDSAQERPGFAFQSEPRSGWWRDPSTGVWWFIKDGVRVLHLGGGDPPGQRAAQAQEVWDLYPPRRFY